ncbi:DUF87 domain-containing protein [Hahella sp. CR1]|uniref:type IV secretory system conjugative DNA transfer family protein n=1 Tax=Hahella sp. CR1 TaxID=2992807 RepID=UPI0024420494|nr:type IV secretory system conjugative DNA transfer family protein [Hahella sp. CR1]MDG9667073.1 DUF87 domain-containing protein [Hahella sp. CR1]
MSGMADNFDISYFGKTNWRPPYSRFGIKQPDRLFHMYVIGKTGAGKSTLLENLIMQDIHAGRGCAFIDPHGDIAECIARRIPKSLQDNFIYLDAADPNQPYGYNPLRGVGTAYIPMVASSIMDVLQQLWGKGAWGVRMEHLLRNTLFALLEYGKASFPDISRLPGDEEFRNLVLAHVKNEAVLRFWTQEWARYTPSQQREACGPIENKVGAFLADPRLYRMLTNPPVQLSIRKAMDEGKVLVVNLAKGKLGADSTRLLGAFLINIIQSAAFSRANIPEHARRPFYLYVDEFQHFTTEAVVSMVSELRKYKVGLVFAHQHLHQLEPKISQAVLSNMGTLISFRLGPLDAPIMAKHFNRVFSADDLMSLPYHSIALSLMIDGSASKPFSANTLSPRTNFVKKRKLH